MCIRDRCDSSSAVDVTLLCVSMICTQKAKAEGFKAMYDVQLLWKREKLAGTREVWAQECPFPFQGLLGAQNGPKDPNNVTGPTGPNGPSDPNDLTGPNGPNDPDDQNNPTMNQCRHFIIKKKPFIIYQVTQLPFYYCMFYYFQVIQLSRYLSFDWCHTIFVNRYTGT